MTAGLPETAGRFYYVGFGSAVRTVPGADQGPESHFRVGLRHGTRRRRISPTTGCAWSATSTVMCQTSMPPPSRTHSTTHRCCTCTPTWTRLSCGRPDSLSPHCARQSRQRAGRPYLRFRKPFRRRSPLCFQCPSCLGSLGVAGSVRYPCGRQPDGTRTPCPPRIPGCCLCPRRHLHPDCMGRGYDRPQAQSLGHTHRAHRPPGCG